MLKELSGDELLARAEEILLKLMSRKWSLEAAGVPPTHDKLFCLWKWQLDEIEAAKAVSMEDAGQYEPPTLACPNGLVARRPGCLHQRFR
jgi:hypothetical protein